MRVAFSVWTMLLKKPDAVESATANEDNLSRFMSKVFLFFFTISMKVLTSGWDVQRQSVL